MFYVYVLKSPKSAYLYYGFSANLKERLKAHRKMPKHAGWQLVFYEAYRNEADARQRERMLKHYGASRGQLKKRIAGSLSMGSESAG